MDKNPYTHVLQKTGVLKNFTVAKIVKHHDLEELKALIKSMTNSEAEYKKILAEEMKKISNMHDVNNPIPGILYPRDHIKFKKLLFTVTKKFCQGIRARNLSKNEMALLITAIINELGLTQEDFINLKNELEDYSGDGDGDDEDCDEDDGPSFGNPPKF